MLMNDIMGPLLVEISKKGNFDGLHNRYILDFDFQRGKIDGSHNPGYVTVGKKKLPKKEIM